MATGPASLVLIRGLLPDVPLKPGAIVIGRVLDPRTLVLEGVRLAAQLPADVLPGERLRLRVQDASGERLALKVVERLPDPAAAAAAGSSAPARESAGTADPAQAAAPAVYPMALPGGAVAQVVVTEREAAARGRRGGEATAVVVRYDSPTLGRLDVRLDAGTAAVHVSDGAPAGAVREAAGALREALARVTGRPVRVTVHPRQETLDVRA